MEMKNRGAPKGDKRETIERERGGELETTMASKSNCNGEWHSRRTIALCCKMSEVNTKTEIVSQSKQKVKCNHE
jgi:hypothetical protein